MKPLQDLRIVSLEQYGAGPFGSVHLADLGAEVIKIEDPNVGGDVGRYVPPYTEGEDSLFYETFNRNKRSISLDLNTDAGRSVFEELVKTADVVYSNLRGDVPALPVLGSAVCLAVVLGVTAAGAVPLHRRLDVGWDADAHRRLLRVDSVRVAAASANVVLAGWLVLS